MTVRNPVVVVTGGTRGIGLGLARELLARRARVVICGRSQASLDKALGELDAEGRVTGITCDVSSRAELQALWDHAVATFGRVDHWVNNAGLGVQRRPLVDIDPASIDAIVGANLLGTIQATAVAVAGMTKQGGGMVWNMEGFGSNGQKATNMATYGATKRGMTYFTECLIKDLKDSPVNIGIMSPGIVVTDLLVDDYEGQPAEFEKAKRIFNILGDDVPTVTASLAEDMLKAKGNGQRVEWLTKGKAAGRFFNAFVLRKKRDLFADQQG